MKNLDTGTVEKILVAFGNLLILKKTPPSPRPPLTVMFSYGPPGIVDKGDIERTVVEQNMDVIHLEFEGGREAAGPVNIFLCEDRNGTVLTWPRCDLWTDRGSLFLIVPRNQDFGFAFDGSAIIRVTDLDTAPALKEGVERARALLRSEAARLPAGLPGVTQKQPAPYLSSVGK